MSQENVEIVTRMLALFHAGNAADALAYFAADVAADASARPDGMVVRGREEMSRMIGEWLAAWEDWSEEIDAIRDLGDKVMVVATQRGRGRETGIDLATQYATVYELRDGEIAAMTLYRGPAEALEAAGLRE
jgi:ketosteroid isomerase-like protein